MKIDKSQSSEGSVVKLSGSIDEDSIFPTIQGPKIILNLEEVTLINSCGIREWVNWLSQLSESSKVELHSCPKVIIDQINNVDGFLPKGGVIESFKVPYYCENCGVLTMMHYKTADVLKGGKVTINETCPCEKCKKEIEMDVIPSKYFMFLGI